jgi:hypothetical protein
VWWWEVVDVRWIFLSILSLFFPLIVRGQVLLNEVFYDPTGTDEGFEFVEIFNPAETAVSLAGCAIEFHDGNSTGWVTVWEASPFDSAAAGGLFVIGGALVEPSPDAIEELSLQNGPDALRLTQSGRVLDLLGYGPLDSPEYSEGPPAPDAASGFGLSRRPDGDDTDDNSTDFKVSAPSPGRFNVARRDVALRRDPETQGRDAWYRAADATFVFWVANAGTHRVEAGSVAVSLSDSSGPGPPQITRSVLPAAIPAGDSVRVEFVRFLDLGVHSIRSCAEFPGDEFGGNDCVQLLRHVGPSELMVSEIMSAPRDGCPEYVELFNSGTVPYELAGHYIRDSAHAKSLLTRAAAPVPPAGFIVLTGDSDGLLACFAGLRRDAVIQIEGNWPSLNQTGAHGVADSVLILDAGLVPVERVAYPPQPENAEGRSLERIDLYPSDGGHTWVLSRGAGGGTPGERSAFASPGPLPGSRIAASPNPFDPYRSEYLFVTVSAQPVSNRVVLDVYDIAGRRVAALGTTTDLPTTFVWDGMDSWGKTVLPGIYVLACEFVAVDGGSRTVEKLVVGCGRKKHAAPRE